MATTSKPAVAEPAALERLERIRDEALMDLAVAQAEAEEDYIKKREWADNERRRWGQVSRMAGLGDLPEYRREYKIVRAS